MKILCFGDSNTYGYDPRSYLGSQYPSQHRWVDILARKLECVAVNAGENGREIPHREWELLRFQLMMTNQKPVDLLLIMLGGNDLLQGNSVCTVVNRMEGFLAQIELERNKIVLVAPPRMAMGAWVPDQSLIDASLALNREYRLLAGRLGIRFVDTDAWNIPLTFDGVHFTEAGHEILAEGLYAVLRGGSPWN